MEIVEELRLLLTSLTLMHEVSGRIMRVEFAKQLRRPPRPHPPGIAAGTPAGETRHKLYISNLAWKVRALQEDLEGMGLSHLPQRRKQRLQLLL